MELSSILTALDLYSRWAYRQPRDSDHRKKGREQAIESVLEAVTETSAYLYDRQSGSRRNRRLEVKISQLWGKAAVRVRKIDKRLSRILVFKSQAWADPSLWDDPEFEQVPISLETIREQCLWLLENDES